MSGALSILVAIATTCAPAGRAIVTEVVYDALGDDTGHEFVELWNPAAVPVSLAGVRIESGDGAGPGRWTLRWTGTATDTIAPGSRFVIGGALVTPFPDRVVNLDLQNGPDAVRVVWPDGVVEVVGWGALAHPEYFCGAPAEDVASGFALVRLPDDADLGSNAADFRAATPSPGRPNQSRRNLAIPPGSLTLAPARPDPGRAASLTGRIANAGRDTIRVGDLAIAIEVEPLSGGGAAFGIGVVPSAARRAADGNPGTLAGRPPHVERALAKAPPVIGPLEMLPGDTLQFEQAVGPLDAGKYRLWVTASVPGDESSADDRDTLRFLVGPGPVAVTEIQFHPADGEGEWVEVRNRAGAPIELARLTLSDRGTARGVPRDGADPLAPESLAVLAQDRLALLARFPGLDPARVWQVTPWAALNNTDDTSGTADAVVLRDEDRLEIERVAYRASGVPSGVPLEFRDGAWQPALDPRGSPGSPPRALPPAAHRFELEPARVPRNDARVNLTWALDWPRARVRADLYDLDGRRVSELLPERSAAGRGSTELTLTAIAPGVYWVVLEARAESGGARTSDARPLRVTGRP